MYTQLKNVNEISERGSQCQQTRRKKGKKEKNQVVHKGPPCGNEFNNSYLFNFPCNSQCPNDFLYHALDHRYEHSVTIWKIWWLTNPEFLRFGSKNAHNILYLRNSIIQCTMWTKCYFLKFKYEHLVTYITEFVFENANVFI